MKKRFMYASAVCLAMFFAGCSSSSSAAASAATASASAAPVKKNIVSTTTTDQTGAVTSYAEYVYNQDGTINTITYYKDDTKATQTLTDVMAYKDGKLYTETRNNDVRTYEYGSNGKPVKATSVITGADMMTVIDYDENGNMAKMTQGVKADIEAGKAYVITVSSTTNAAKQPLVETQNYPDGKTATITHEYDADGNETKEVFDIPAQKQTLTTIFKY
jgi:antitoxin component YwqK of YwqJK toxin-antitoxin module